MPNPTVTFTLGPESIEISGPDYNEHPGRGMAQFVQQAMGGRITALTQATAVQHNPVLTWNTLPDAEYLLLLDFIETVAVGAENIVTYEDYRGTTWDAVYLGGIEDAEQDDFQLWSVKLKFRLYEV